jgi:cathepsin L
MKTILVLAFLAIAFAYEAEWQSFKSAHNKAYYSAEEHNKRFKIFRENLDFIRSHDSEKAGFTVGMNYFGDLTNQEFRALLNGMNVTVANKPQHYAIKDINAPDSWDWRTKGAVTGVKNQGQCGSCWSFSATGSMEGVHFIKTGKLVSLSEQNLVDCSVAEGNEGCNGGLMDQAFQYVIKNNGIDTEASYPYTATGPNACRFSRANVGATITSYHDIPSGSESALLNAVYLNPTSVAIDASHMSFQFYNGGVYYEPACSSSQLDHGVLAVGYGTYQGAAFWQVKNSWGTGWGMNGYIMMSRNRNNNCGIATAASYPIA